ncbi:MAG: aminotransferase class I/II-fold pyridoxal phosphate-dependent enzyme [Lysobacteraceae bacterium]
MPQLARRMGKARPSAIMLVAEKARKMKAEGRDVVNFSIGVPNFLPGEHVYAAARAALDADDGLYGSNRGADALLDAFLQHLERSGLSGYTRRNLCVGIGAKHILYSLAEALLDPGDTLAFATPYWTTYQDIADILDAKVLALRCPPERNYKLTPEQLDEALSLKPKVFLFNNPSNPSGMVYHREEIEALAEVVARHPEPWIVLDDIYNRLVFDGIGYHNFLHFKPELRERTIVIDSLSKTYGMPGWRVGFAAAPEAVAQALATLNSSNITSLPLVVTAAATAALSGPQDVPVRKCAEFSGKRDLVLAALAKIPGVRCPRPEGAFYVFPDISVAFGKTHAPTNTVIGNDVEFCSALLEAKAVACVPGSPFGEPSAMRISYTCSDAALREGLNRIEAFFAELRD